MAGLLARLADATHDHVLDRRRINPRAHDHVAQYRPGEIGWMPAGKLAVAAAPGGAAGFDDKASAMFNSVWAVRSTAR